ncbi:MAG: pyruvate, phosphate dikinase [Acidimicrobiia bacterium]
MTYVYSFGDPHRLPRSEARAVIGGKAANIAAMVELGLPVPPGFTVGTSACRAYLADGWPEGLDDEIRHHLGRLEQAVGRGFGDPRDPLLVSVRSGAAVSMPGMMDTILNLGLNDATTEGLVAVSGDRPFADACRQRFEEVYREVVGVAVPDDPWQQLRDAIEAVFRSWNSDRARAYRVREAIPDDLGTAVTIQAMVFGNRGEDSATGVLFTRNPATGQPTHYGDIMFRAQGDDVVAGTHRTEPLSVLDERMPEVAEELRRYADALEPFFTDVCDIEFTIERGRLWMLQVRIGKRSPQAALRIAVEMAEDESFPLSRAEAVERVAPLLADPPTTTGNRSGDAQVVATGLPASPGVASGEIVTRPDDAVVQAEAGKSVILVRSETSPEDVHGMARAAGILTATGGLTSHAAVVARGWGIPAVVGAQGVRVDDGTVSIGDLAFVAGDIISIDGGNGEVFAGEIASTATVVPEAEILLSWARELGIEIQGSKDISVPDHKKITEAGELSVDSLVRILLIKGFATADQIAAALGTTPDEASSVLDRLAADGLAELTGGMFRLTPDGRALADEMIAADRAQWGTEQAEEALDAFVAIDQRVKQVVTAWQMREVDGEQVLNDHSDPDYDSSVLADVGAVHTEAVAWLRPLTSKLSRLDDYLTRLDRAAELARQGDHVYIASPTVDSYHSIWFELHEDLIVLAGRTREDEAAAGRA